LSSSWDRRGQYTAPGSPGAAAAVFGAALLRYGAGVHRLTLLLLLLPAPRALAAVPTAVLGDGSAGAREIEARVRIDPRFAPADWRAAQLIWVIGAPLTPAQQSAILARVRGGAGLVLICGRAPPDLSAFGLRVEGQRVERATLQVRGAAPAALTSDVVWPSAPQVGRRWSLAPADTTPNAGLTLTPLAIEEGSGRPVLLLGRLGAGRVAIFGLQLADPSNRELVLWPYFGYLIYALSAHASGAAVEPFAAWQHSPVPGSRTLWILLGLFGLAWIGTLLLFYRARRYSRAHPEELTRFFAEGPKPAPGGEAAPARGAWSSVGFTRPLAGFLTLVGAMFVLFAPYYYVTNIVIPNDVQPFPQAKGIWDFAWEVLQVAWFLFDAGTFVAFVKYFAEFRIKDPAEALRSVQFFVWWQILTGLVQVTMAVLVAVLVLPHTRYGFSSNFVILIALSQYPGFFAVVTFFFQAYQRFDYNIGLDLLSDWVLRFGLQIPFVLLFRAWGQAHPEYGEAFGAVIGIGVGYYVSTIVTFGIGVLLYRRLGLRLLPLFLAHFDRKTVARMLSFGLKVVAGQAFFRAAMTIDRIVISVLLLNYTEWLGIQGQIHYNLMFLFPIAYRFFETAMAALSESHGNGKRTLTQYYLARFFQVGALYTAIGVSLLWALGPMFIRYAMDVQWARAGDYILIAALIGLFYAPAWLSDMLQKGADRPGLFAWVLGAEQALRIGLFYLLIPRWQFTGFYLALLLTIALKVVAAWTLNHLLIVRLRLYLWQMLVAPAMAGLANFALWRLVGAKLQLTGRVEVIVLFLAASLLSFFICFFVCGLCGGFDRALASELEEASRMTGPLRPLTRCFYHAARAGWALSPLHDRFPVAIHAAAMEEARALQEQPPAPGERQ
jgi:O-antigen/teichoic acid export membrane protein